MTKVQVFEFASSLRLRTVEIDGNPWFVATDVCKALEHKNVTRDVARHVDPEDKRTVSVGLRGKAPVVVNESGLYCLIFGSTKPVAKDSRRWVTSEVLPVIRKRGVYLTDAKAHAVLANPEAGAAQLLADARAQLAEKDAQIARLHADVHDAEWVTIRRFDATENLRLSRGDKVRRLTSSGRYRCAPLDQTTTTATIE